MDSRALYPQISQQTTVFQTDAVLRRLRRNFQCCGGLLPANSVAALMRPGINQPVSQLAHWIVDRQIVHFAACAETLLPLFQFHPSMSALRPGMAALMAELSGVMDDWELAQWFASPNLSLNGAWPAVMLATQPILVLEAARLDRFLIDGD